jgi:hypothetical protein
MVPCGVTLLWAIEKDPPMKSNRQSPVTALTNRPCRPPILLDVNVWRINEACLLSRRATKTFSSFQRHN